MTTEVSVAGEYSYCADAALNGTCVSAYVSGVLAQITEDSSVEASHSQGATAAFNNSLNKKIYRKKIKFRTVPTVLA
jgi:hypothetical protein